MRNFKVRMAYCGTRYHGYQIQNNAVTIQEIVERCVGKVLNERVSIQGCSRTDTGVHARDYCFSVQTNSAISTRGFVRGVNGELPSDISILSCEEVAEEFHARFCCCGKEYLYLIHNSESKNPFLEHLAYHYRRPFATERVQEAAQYFVGTHDFRAFCSNCADAANTVRTIHDFTIKQNGEQIQLLVRGDGFLYNMVRIMVGTLFSVNEGRILASDIAEILASRDRTRAGRTALPHGLYLNRVFYDTMG